ncbi:xanthine dehydrogenase family protein molybdopterin-binding subunit [Parasphingorhabdus pacifica]
MGRSLLGNEVNRIEDPDLLRGRGTYVDNTKVEGVLHLAFLRSSLAHALITRVDVSEALAAPGVVAAYSADDLPMPPLVPFVEVNSACTRYPLGTDRVRFAGEPVAVVVAESAAQAADALELIDVDYEPLPAAVDVEEALQPDAPTQFPELGTNIAIGERDPVGPEVLDDADVVVRARLENQRMAVAPIEGNAVVVVPGGSDEDYDVTIRVSTQMPHGVRSGIAATFGWDPDRVRVIAPHVGGAFGGKVGAGAEHVLAVAIAQRLGRPAKWTETRTENLQAMPQGRAQVQYAELGLRSDGTIAGLRCRMIGDSGAYAGFAGALVTSMTRVMAQGVYRIPAISYAALGALTNTAPVGAFRGAGRPEAAAMLERMIDIAAAELAMDPVELRKRNFLQPSEFPYTTLTHAAYDSGDYELALTEALRLADYEALRAEQARRIEAGENMLLGIGVSSYVEITGGGAGEYAHVEMHERGATIKVGTSAHGQGHATAFSMIVADLLNVPMESIEFVQADTGSVPRGGGTAGSRSMQIGGSAVRGATETVLRKAKELAADRLEAAVEDIEVIEDGHLGVSGAPNAKLSWSQLVRFAAEDDHALAAEIDFQPDGATFPFGAHVSVVEVDSETGYVRPLRHIAVDDCGRVLNPVLVRGQQHGGAAQGISQALWEQFSYDVDGNPATATLADYTIPTAVELPWLETANTETPTTRNPMGAKGIGESATVGATPAVQNAVVDALRHLGVRHIDLPATPQRVWRAMRDAEAGKPPVPWQEPPEAFDALPVRGAHADDSGEAVA